MDKSAPEKSQNFDRSNSRTDHSALNRDSLISIISNGDKGDAQSDLVS